MKAACFLLPLVGFTFAALAQASGLAWNDRFIVLAPDQRLAEDILDSADRYRMELARTWLLQEPPRDSCRTAIHLVKLSTTQSEAHSWLKDSPDRRLHRIWITCPPEEVNSLLQHELSHVFLADWLSRRLPPWADEGVAGLADDSERKAVRRRIIRDHAADGRWPSLADILDAPRLRSYDQVDYATATSLTEYLLSRGNNATFLRFAQAGSETGWDRALHEHYGITSIDHLQTDYERWASATAAGMARTSKPTTGR